MTALARSLHIGVNHVDPNHYQGWSPNLTAAEQDAADMQSVAKAAGFQTEGLVGSEATSDRVQETLKRMATDLGRGDIAFLTFSGCGGEAPDTNADERDPGNLEDTWVLFDRQWMGDELGSQLAGFRAGVRLLLMADTCGSGTVVRALSPELMSGLTSSPSLRPKFMPPRQAQKIYRANRALYDAVQQATPPEIRQPLRASLLVFTAAQRNQVALDGERNSLFTAHVLKVWQRGRFEGSYRGFRDKIAQRMPPSQSPGFEIRGKPNPTFLDQKPFTI